MLCPLLMRRSICRQAAYCTRILCAWEKMVFILALFVFCFLLISCLLLLCSTTVAADDRTTTMSHQRGREGGEKWCKICLWSWWKKLKQVLIFECILLSFWMLFRTWCFTSLANWQYSPRDLLMDDALLLCVCPTDKIAGWGRDLVILLLIVVVVVCCLYRAHNNAATN